MIAKYKLIIDEWFKNGFVGYKAYQKFYKTSKQSTAEVNFSRIKSIPEIGEYIEKMNKQLVERNKVDIDECVTYLAKMMRFDIADLYNDDGSLKPIKDIHPDIRLAIAELSIFEEFDNASKDKDLIGFTKKIKTVDRKGVIVELMKYLGGYEKDNNQKKPDPEINIKIFR